MCGRPWLVSGLAAGPVSIGARLGDRRGPGREAGGGGGGADTTGGLSDCTGGAVC